MLLWSWILFALTKTMSPYLTFLIVCVCCVNKLCMEFIQFQEKIEANLTEIKKQMEGLGAKIDTCHSKSVYGLIYEMGQACQIPKCKDFNYNLMLKIVFFFLGEFVKRHL